MENILKRFFKRDTSYTQPIYPVIECLESIDIEDLESYSSPESEPWSVIVDVYAGLTTHKSTENWKAIVNIVVEIVGKRRL